MKIEELLQEAFTAGANNKMKPFTTDLCGVDCPDFDEWLIQNKAKVKNLAQPDVSGNEANPEIKQSGEVAVCDHRVWAIGHRTVRCWKCGKEFFV